jgi:hypothetical protein
MSILPIIAVRARVADIFRAEVGPDALPFGIFRKASILVIKPAEEKRMTRSPTPNRSGRRHRPDGAERRP